MGTEFNKYCESLTQSRAIEELDETSRGSWISGLKATQDSSSCSSFPIYDQHCLGSQIVSTSAQQTDIVGATKVIFSGWALLLSKGSLTFLHSMKSNNNKALFW